MGADQDGKRAPWRGHLKAAALLVLTIALAVAGAALAFAASAPQPPVLGHSVNVAPVSGSVYVTVPGGRSARLTAPKQVPVGSLIDAAHGKVELTAADVSGSAPYSGQFSQGEFKVEQSAGGGGTTDILLQGACTKAPLASADPPATVARRHPSKVRRYLAITANGKFAIIAGSSTAYEVGAAAWVVDDNCNGSTSVVGKHGHVNVRHKFGIPQSQLAPGQSDNGGCGPRTGRVLYCEDVFSDAPSNLTIFSFLLLHRRATRFEWCLQRNGRDARCETFVLKPLAGDKEGDQVACTLDSLPRGTYETRFSVQGEQVGVPLPWVTDHLRDPFGAVNQCQVTYLTGR
ncbi:MAG TPA: hypothetical protein VMD48_00305 [Solirubrobacteraceae bacterium]|nr:hypothetical protein [Solirubrobacteraceae bacterium]